MPRAPAALPLTEQITRAALLTAETRSALVAKLGPFASAEDIARTLGVTLEAWAPLPDHSPFVRLLGGPVLYRADVPGAAHLALAGEILVRYGDEAGVSSGWGDAHLLARDLGAPEWPLDVEIVRARAAAPN